MSGSVSELVREKLSVWSERVNDRVSGSVSELVREKLSVWS